MAYISYQDWAAGGLCNRPDINEDLDLREEFLIMALLFLEWLFFVGFLAFLTFQIILQPFWKNEEEQEVDDITMLQKQEEEVDEYGVNEYEEDGGFEFQFSEHFYEDLDFMEDLNEEDSEEEDDSDSGTSSVCLTVARFLNGEVNYKLFYYFHDLGILESQSVVTDEPTTSECETSDETFEGISDEEQWSNDENGDSEGGPYDDWDYKDGHSPECYFPV